MKPPAFLDTPSRGAKPRQTGMTHVIDSGTGLAEMEDRLAGTASLVDIVKLGWGTSYVDPRAPEKVERLRSRGIQVSLGGTLLEASLRCGRLAEFRSWAKELGVDIVEVSSGTLDIPSDKKLGLIEDLARDFTVVSEVGSKDVDIVMAPYRWVEAIRSELEAGAWKVITEGRESGTAGVYRRNGEIRHGLIEEIVAAVEPRNIIFEAPITHQQAWFIQTFGPEVNLGNIGWRDVIPLETLRLGLRSDTLLALLPDKA
jgi:phosphosulfolactate synthase